MLSKFEKKVAGFIEANALLGSADKVLLAVSGGADSTALLHVMCALKAENVLPCDIICAHLNHQLRDAESDGDEAFVIAQADKLNLAVTTRRLDVRGFAGKNKLSIETAARKLRMESLLDIAKANNCKQVVTAHHKDDNAETVIQRLARGTGFRGLAGIWPMRTFSGGISFVRPLLCVSRDEIIDYLNKRNLKWRIDRTNDNCSFRRNFIRHRLLPALQQQCDCSITEQLSELSQSSQKFYSLVCSGAEKIWSELADCSADNITLDLEKFQIQPSAVKVEIVRRSLTNLGSGEKDLTYEHYENILQLAQQKTSGRKLELPVGFVARREYGNLIFTRQRKGPAVKKSDKIVELQVPGQTQFGSFLIEATVLEADKRRFEKFKQDKSNFIEWLDLDKVKLPLVIRFRKDGDRFTPLGLASDKKIGKFLTDEKVPEEIRRKILIVADAEKIIWVWPIRISEQAKVREESRRILQLKIGQLVPTGKTSG
ncbi:MAG: tRNA lysidine(34) synthetase TilS [Phycisphaerae bacterium]|jgi:tRNA(Ile)-lysidine synthase